MEFPYDKVNKSIYSDATIKKWLPGNTEIKNKGIETYYEKNKDVSH